MTDDQGRAALVPCIAAASCALLLGGYLAWGSHDFCLDDAWTHLAYAKSLKLGDGFSYNPGDRETGFSSPLWVALLALVPWRAGDDPVPSVKALGVLGHVLLAWASARLGAALATPERARASAWVAGLLVACDPLLSFASNSGMEVTLAAALLTFTLVSITRDAAGAALTLAAASIWARPECLFVLASFCVLRREAWRRRSTWLALLGAAGALLAWIAYAEAVSGWAWPNTYYAKRGGSIGRGLAYMLAQVLPAQAWSLGLTGLGLFALSLRRPSAAQQLALATIVSVIAVAASREVTPGVGFYCSRYFAVFASLPCIVIASQLPQKLASRALLLAPIAAANLWLLPQARQLARAQEASIATLHTQPARYLAQTLPRTATIAVEGAGATRFFLPRSVGVVDILGLNASSIVHRDGLARLCAIGERSPSHVLLPAQYYASFATWFEFEPLREFVDPHYALTLRPRIERVTAARVIDDEKLRAACVTAQKRSSVGAR